MTHPILHDMLTSNGQPHEMTNTQTARLRADLLDNLFLFAWLIFDYHDLNRTLHGEICELMRRWGTPNHKRLLVQIPRGHLKTSLCTIANSLWQVCKHPNEPVAIINERQDNTGKWIRAIKDVVTSSVIFQEVFKDLLPPGVHRDDRRSMPRWWRWSDTEMDLQRGQVGIPEASITGLGIGSASAGGHWNKIIKDDLISEDAKNSPSVMERAKDWLDNSFALERPALGGQDLIVCTPWLYNDLYAYALDKYDYQLYRRQALENDAPIFPEKFDQSELEKLQARDPYHFASQFMCQPRPGREQAFEASWLRFGTVQGHFFHIDHESYDPNLKPEDVPEPPSRIVPLSAMDKVLLFDPAPSEDSEKRKNADARNALVVEGIDYWGRRYILDVWADRVSPPEVLSQIFFMLEAWGCQDLAVEEVVFSVLYKHWIQDHARRRNKHLRIIPLKPSNRTKDARIQAKIGPFEKGHYYINHSVKKPFIREYLEYPYSKTRDILDAIAYDDDPTVIQRPLSPEEVEKFREANQHWWIGYQGVDEITGY